MFRCKIFINQNVLMWEHFLYFMKQIFSKQEERKKKKEKLRKVQSKVYVLWYGWCVWKNSENKYLKETCKNPKITDSLKLKNSTLMGPSKSTKLSAVYICVSNKPCSCKSCLLTLFSSFSPSIFCEFWLNKDNLAVLTTKLFII